MDVFAGERGGGVIFLENLGQRANCKRKEIKEGEWISPGSSAAMGWSFVLKDYRERRKDAQRSHHSQLAELAGLLQGQIKLLQNRG